ncbi:MAG: type II toxin-antitoxin system VapC family toxin [Nitrososphaerales archaeon]
MPSLSTIDTSVLVEFIDEDGDFHAQARGVVESITSGRLTGIIPHPVFVELYYVSYKLYEKNRDVAQSKRSPELKAETLINWIFKSPNILVPEDTIELAIAAGKIKQKFSLALTDSYVIACAKLQQCIAIFKSQEEEMSKGNKIEKIETGEDVRLIFLEDYA